MRADEITDKESLERWLNGRPQADSICIAQRAALRVFPAWGYGYFPDWPGNSLLKTLPVLRISLISGVQCRRNSQRLIDAALDAGYAAGDDTSSTVSLAARSVNRASTGLNRDRSLDEAVHAVSSALRSTQEASLQAQGTVGKTLDWPASIDKQKAVDEAGFWSALSADAELAAAAADLRKAPLWHNREPDWFKKAWKDVQTVWNADSATWDFWRRWYQGVVDGTPMSDEFLHAIALMPDDDWKQGPAHVAAEIREIELSHAIDATPNGEAIEINPDTGRLRVVPVTDLPEDVALYARRKIQKAVNLFSGDTGNQYAALSPDCAMLADAIHDAANLPLELFDSCASASRRLNARVRNGDCPPPETDPLIADYQARLREAGADILANDPQTQQVLAARNAIIGNDALVANDTVIRAAADLLLPIVEGVLARTLPVDAAVATELKADAEDRKVASVRWAGRVVRIAKIMGGVVGTVVGTAAFLEAIPVIWASPIFQAAYQAALRYLGF